MKARSTQTRGGEPAPATLGDRETEGVPTITMVVEMVTLVAEMVTMVAEKGHMKEGC